MWIGRRDHVNKLADYLTTPQDDEHRIRILSMAGPGGSGKSHLFQHTYEDKECRAKFADRKYLRLTVTATECYPTLANLLTIELVKSCQQRGNDKTRITFDNLTKCSQTLSKMNAIAQEQVKESMAKANVSDPLIDALIQLGVFGIELYTNAAVAQSIQKFVKSRPELIDSAIGYFKKYADIFSKETFFERELTTRLRKDIGTALAESLVKDVETALNHEPGIDPHLSNLLLVFDNFERYVDIIDTFIFQNLVPALRRSNFYTTIVVLGRDPFETSSTYIIGVGSKVLSGVFDSSQELHLTEFDEEEADSFLEQRGIKDKSEREKICKEFGRYPYILNAVASLSPGGMSAQANRAFFIRTCYWLTPQQQDWIRTLAFLDKVEVGTIKKMLPSEDAKKVYTWFVEEKSLKDPSPGPFMVNKLLRRCIMTDIKNEEESLYNKLRSRAKEAMQILTADKE